MFSADATGLAGPDRERGVGGWDGKAGAETPDAGGRRAPAVLDSGQRPGDVCRANDRGRRESSQGTWRGTLLTCYVYFRYFEQVRPVRRGREKKETLSLMDGGDEKEELSRCRMSTR